MITVYHNPDCSKSRRALELLWDRGVAFDVVEYLVSPPDRETLQRLVELSGENPSVFVRTTDPAFREAGLKLEDGASAADVAELVSRHPAVLQRPIAVSGERVVIGRPPERILDVLGEDQR